METRYSVEKEKQSGAAFSCSCVVLLFSALLQAVLDPWCGDSPGDTREQRWWHQGGNPGRFWGGFVREMKGQEVQKETEEIYS